VNTSGAWSFRLRGLTSHAEKPLTTLEVVRRASPPQVVQKLRENFYLVQVALNEPPSADWKRLFYDAQLGVQQDFVPRSVEMISNLLRFRSDAADVEQRVATIDRWIERANQKEASMGGRPDEGRRLRREEMAREQQEIAELNARWTKL
jgi:hypothetical protein